MTFPVHQPYSTVPIPKPDRTLSASPSDPVQVATSTPESSPPQQIYVLTADGSSLFLLDPTKPSGNEIPPPYAPFRLDVNIEGVDAGTDVENGIPTEDHPVEVEIGPIAGPSSPQQRRQRPAGVPFPTLVLTGDGEHLSRHRARTMSAINQPPRESTSPVRPRPRNHASFSHGSLSTLRVEHRPRSTLSSPGVSSAPLADEQTPLLARSTMSDGEEWVNVRGRNGRGFWRDVFCGEIEWGEDERSWKQAWKRFWRPVGDGSCWKAILHLWFINFPFVSVFPNAHCFAADSPGVIGMATTGRWDPCWNGPAHYSSPWCRSMVAHLVYIPFCRSTRGMYTSPTLTFLAPLELIFVQTAMQLYYHSPLDPSIPLSMPHPIFYRIKERSIPNSPISPASESAPDVEIVWEKRFMKCSYAMVSSKLVTQNIPLVQLIFVS